MATVADRKIESPPIVLKKVPYRLYERLRDEPSNDHLRMTYIDGTLEIMSPEPRHERPSRVLCAFILTVATELQIPCLMMGSSTFRKVGDGPRKGKGKEPDEAFYLANAERVVNKETIDLATDPPPDLWIEIDNRGNSRGRLPLYAALGIPEVWRYRARKKTLWFGRLVDGSYQAIDRSESLPMLTPALVLEALGLGQGLTHSEWNRLLREWIRERLQAPGGPGIAAG